MKTKPSLLNKNQGFTLLEVVITLIVGSILGAILVQFMGTSMQKSFEPVVMVQNNYGVYEIMERMNAHYKMRLLTSTVNPLDDFKTDVEAGWNIASTPYFGEYTVVTKYIRFVSGIEHPLPDPAPTPRVLKVTITHGGQSLSALFTI
ncbi:MAG: prepilin-type N-terminal cleavage/methylation domain-containing protein [Deltaproteobacteria bacterium]|nr:prepilin-type N-terminal cleavage/methylation domain-containing protein [Deltaproteobacteria bacterium]